MLISPTGRLCSLSLPASGWVTVVMVAFLNWLADVGVLAASVVAVGAPVPLHQLLDAYLGGLVDVPLRAQGAPDDDGAFTH